MFTRKDMMQWRPMLAGNFKEGKHDYMLHDANFVQEAKLNGERCIAVITPKGAQFFTRTLSRVDGLPGEKTAWLPHLNKLTVVRGTLILDGELVTSVGLADSDHTKVGTLLNCSLDKSLARQKKAGFVHYIVFDCLCIGKPASVLTAARRDGGDIRDLPFVKRRTERNRQVELLQLQMGEEYIHIVPDGDDAEYAKTIISGGGEGVIVKDLRAEYYPDARPAGVWMKIKESIELDLFITGYKAAKEVSRKSDGTMSSTKYAGLIGSVVLSAAGIKDGKCVAIEVCNASGIDDALRRKISANPNHFINAVCRVKAQKVCKDKTGKLSLQNPRIVGLRDDKASRDCKYSDLLK